MGKQRSRNEHIKGNAVEKGFIDGYEYWVSPGPIEGLNGYVKFPTRPVREEGYRGILTYVPVHGGITYCEEDEMGVVYGFDTAHYDSHLKPRNDRGWVKEQCEIMLRGILKAKEVEKKYLGCVSQKGKSKYAEMVLNIQPEEWQNFGVMINLLSGEI